MRDVIYIYIYIIRIVIDVWNPRSIGRQMLSINPRKIVQSRETSNVSIGPITDVSQSQESKSRTDVSKALTRRQTEFRAQVAHRIALRGLWIHPQ